MHPKYKEIYLKAKTKEAAETEIMYELAAARADAIEFVRLNISIIDEAKDNLENKKVLSCAIRTLKNMKSDGRIQFFATEDGINNLSTEAIFLMNKYPDHFDNIEPSKNGEVFVYIKL